MLGLLFRLKVTALSNRVRQAVNDAPLRVTATVLLIGVVWVGLYTLFWLIFNQLSRTPLEATVALPLVFNVFFIAMLALLTFSNAIIAYGALFGREESSYLLAAPLSRLDFVTLKYVESLVMSSWSLIVLGLPLMFAMARQAREPYFHVLFIAFFLAFIPIPGALGMMLAWAAGRFFPKRMIRLATGLGAVLLLVALIAGMRSLELGDGATEVWLKSFLARMSFVQSAFLPNQWIAAGIDNALQGRLEDSTLYLCVTLANALLLSWIAVRLVARRFSEAYDRASSGRGAGAQTNGQSLFSTGEWLFFYLSKPLRLIAAKDLRTFFRDPLQWTQLLILFGLLVLYLTNMPNLRFGVGGRMWQLLGPFLNLCAISLILATFTCRFVFPLVSLEGRNLWMIGLLPIRRGRLLWAKFAFAMTVTLAASIGAAIMAAILLELKLVWSVIHIVVTVAICFGLCALSVGIGARMPMFHERNVARIANGLGGTTNLLASLGLVSAVLTCVGVATFRAFDHRDLHPDPLGLSLCLLAIVVAFAAGMAALRLGSRHFERVEM